jgi:hypothetical protein
MPNLPEEIADLITSSVTKAGTEPAEPAEGEVTKGEVGVGRRQTFKYMSNSEEALVVKLKHDLGTQFVQAALYLAASSVILPVLHPESPTEVRIDINEGELKKGKIATIVLSA